MEAQQRSKEKMGSIKGALLLHSPPYPQALMTVYRAEHGGAGDHQTMQLGVHPT